MKTKNHSWSTNTNKINQSSKISAPPHRAKKTHSRFAGLWSPAAHRHHYLHLPRSPPPANSLPTERSLVAIEIPVRFPVSGSVHGWEGRRSPSISRSNLNNATHRPIVSRGPAPPRTHGLPESGPTFFFFAVNLLS